VTIADERLLAAVAAALGAETVGILSASERELLNGTPHVPSDLLADVRRRIRAGEDPLGTAFCEIRSVNQRRLQGAVYTPGQIVAAMLDWAQTIGQPARVVEPGAGSAPFLLEAGKRFPNAQLVAVELDPLAALMARANLSMAGLAGRARVIQGDFLTAKFDVIEGRTLYIGNPPYVRHHLITPQWKVWLKREAANLKLEASTLAGLHVYFFLAIARWAKAGDYGALITAAEWLDVNYGQLVRELFTNRLGGQSVFIIEPTAEPFPGTLSTGAITTFTVNGVPSSARFARIATLDKLGNLTGGRRIRRERLLLETRWSHFTRTPKMAPEGYVELGELCRVHRGQVTGANRVWIAGTHSEGLPDEYLFPTVTKAMELIQAGPVLDDSAALRRVIDLPPDLSAVSTTKRRAVDSFLIRAEEMGARDSYIAQNRKAWWAVGLYEPAPILATYMARRPPSFVRNLADARHLNIAHGLYPREVLAEDVVTALVRYLRTSASMQGGRVYSGGLTKFEPREMERIPVPEPKVLLEMK
jgi:hypothetical protein